MSGLCDNCGNTSADLEWVDQCFLLCTICRDAELKRQTDGPGADWEPDFNAESGKERHEREYQEKYR